LSRDVFVPPKFPLILSILVGTGINLLANLLCLMTLVCLGFVQFTHRGQTLTVMIIFHYFFSILSGYFSARFYKMIKGEQMLKLALLCAVFYPGVNFLIFLLVNLILEIE
jgi:transmembrane 9 superfamily member 2/4